MQIIFHANDIIEAHLVAGLLEANNIHAFVNGHYLQGGVGELSPLGFANVMVSNDDVDLASPFIAEYEANKLEMDVSDEELEKAALAPSSLRPV